MNRTAIATFGYSPLTRDLRATFGYQDYVRFLFVGKRRSRLAETEVVFSHGETTVTQSRGHTSVRYNRSEGVVRQ